MNIVIFEDEGYKNFLPLTWTRPVYQLRCGINTLAEKIARHYPKAKVHFSCRYYLPGEKLMRLGRGLFINGRVLAGSGMGREIPLHGQDEVFMSGDEIVAIRAVNQDYEAVRAQGKVKRMKFKLLKYPWELINLMGEEIREDRKHMRFKGQGARIRGVFAYNAREIIVDEGAQLEAGAVLDARHGPIYIGKGSIVRPTTYLKGPLVLGPECRVGGEVGESIFHGFSNKQHYGFIGHSYVEEWVNLGAGTTNSDLKNNYGSIKLEINGQLVDSGEQFVGCFIGDHVKTGIGTLITTGARIGVAANIFGGGVTLKMVPSFSWGSKGRYELDKALATIKMVMERRHKTFSKEDDKIIRYLYRYAA
jgi:UDP-N-acetylglucosamine diphosphorylase/glucosamine-1-phosphate N-acetyltransferase